MPCFTDSCHQWAFNQMLTNLSMVTKLVSAHFVSQFIHRMSLLVTMFLIYPDPIQNMEMKFTLTTAG